MASGTIKKGDNYRNVSNMYMYGSVVSSNQMVFAIDNTYINTHSITVNDISFVGVSSVMQCTPTNIEVGGNGVVVTVSENLASYIGRFTLLKF